MSKAAQTSTAGKHSPGPWVVNGEVREVGADGGEKHRLYCADIVLGAEWRGYVASVQSCDHIDGITREEAEANARLIAAAPDLLKAAEKFIAQWNACGPNSDFGRFFKNVRDEMVTALAAAKGAGQ
ncbi:TPA: hypothetical protein O5T86_001281 [Staphylococcus aureus]|nr:hypothetical protein [Staphylococcus aureus]HDA7217736.1 hypothetical protein [Staphylococcus aureus]HDA7235032.1 hypothetical protein [Staphylococcus aureus]HDA7236818.1 hypothetical protein [Staphylococcus aureus]HDA7239244.1 hypothetical protein [Staphylococcus aureus]